MEKIPDEIIRYIFCYISTYELSTVVSKVCKKWELIVVQDVMSVKDAKQLIMFNEGLKAVIVTEPVWNLQTASQLITSVIYRVPRLSELTICNSFPLDDEDYKSLLSMPCLKHLDVFGKRKCMDKSLAINPKVTTLVVNETIATGFLTNLGQSNKLKGFHMYGRALNYMVRQMMDFLQIQSETLRELTLRCQELGDENNSMTDSNRLKIICQCIGLSSLQLHKCSLLTRHGVVHVAKLEKLCRLHLTGARLLRSAGVLALISSLPPLVEDLNLSYSDFGSEHCTALALRLPRLRALELWRCGAGRGVPAQGAPGQGAPVQGIPGKEVAGRGVVGQRVPGLDADALLRLVQNLEHLQILDTDVFLDCGHFESLSRHPTLRKLRCQWKRLPQPMKPELSVTSAQTEYAREYLRGDAEGPSAELYYCWTRGVPLRPLQGGRSEHSRKKHTDNYCV